MMDASKYRPGYYPVSQEWNSWVLKDHITKAPDWCSVDLRDGKVAIKGWTEESQETAFEFCGKMQEMGVRTIIVTDISKDGAMKGTNHGLYEELAAKFDMQIVASGGVSSIDDVKRLAAQNIYGAIIGKAYYTGATDLREAIAAGAGDELCVAELLEEKK